MHRGPWPWIAGCLAALALLSHAAALEPARGRLLIASPDLLDPNFHRTVVLLLDYGGDGAIGLVVNRPGRLGPAQALPEFEELRSYRGRLYYGGPVALRAMLLLVRGTQDDWDTEQVFDDIHVSGDPQVLRQAAGLRRDDTLRIYAGYAGWSPGQLDREIAEGAWRVIVARADLVFTSQPERLWERLMPENEPLQVRGPDRNPSRPPTVIAAGRYDARQAAVLRSP